MIINYLRGRGRKRLDLSSVSFPFDYVNGVVRRYYRKKISLARHSGAISNFQANIPVTYTSGMEADFSDLLFTSSDGETNLSYWISTKTDSVSATVYVLIPSLLATYTEIYMYYGVDGTVTSPSNIDTTMDAGLRVFLYDGTAFNSYIGTTIDTSPSYDWGSGTVSINGVGNQTDTCSNIWQGWVKPDGVGNTIFYTTSDDGQRLYIAGSLVIDNWNDQGATERNYTYNLQTPTWIQYNWYENGGGAVARIGWDSVNSAKVYPIPSTHTRCRKYLATEPTAFFHNEEKALRAP